ncbi:hypothetical protein K7I13_07990 [Brucepastera parasyntrophica]|nr:hypothetical protein [Brucepastera parasyntrophica]ULQ58516.1 hypothetical protein K7I13_07990 [Brucepastera parasyntrophica]
MNKDIVKEQKKTIVTMVVAYTVMAGFVAWRFFPPSELFCPIFQSLFI